MDSVTDTKPLPHRELHGEVHARSGQKLENGRLAEGTVETNLDRNVPKPISNLVDQETKTIDGTLRVVNATWTVHDVEKLTCLGEMSGQRVVGWVFGMMRIETVFSAFDGSSRANDGAVEIDRNAPKFSVCPS